jgi:hypothetical protein
MPTLTRDMPRISGGTVTATSASAIVTGVGMAGGWQATVADRITRNFGRGSWLRVGANQPVMILSCDSDAQLTLVRPWPNATIAASVDYEIINPTINSVAQVADQVDALLRRGSITSPFTDISVDGGVARMKLGETSGSLAGIFAGLSSGGDAGLSPAITIDPTTKQVSFPFGSTEAGENLLLNGSTLIWQRNTSFTATGYTADRVHATITGAITVLRATTQIPAGCQYMISATGGVGGGTVEFKMCTDNAVGVGLRSKVVTVSCRLGRSVAFSGGTVSIALEYRTSATEAMTTGAWTPVPLNAAVIDPMVYAIASVAPTNQGLLSVTGAVPSNVQGLRVRIYHSLPIASTEILYVGAIKLEVGLVATPFKPVSFESELRRCLRFYCKSYEYQTVPGALTSLGMVTTTAASGGLSYYTFDLVRFRTEMRIAPTMVYYNPATVNAGDLATAIRNYSGGGADLPMQALAPSYQGVLLRVNNTVLGVNHQIGVHYTADAEML